MLIINMTWCRIVQLASAYKQMVVDTQEFNQYHVSLLLQNLGYVMWAEVGGQAHLIKQVRMVGGDGLNIEVLTSQGWKVPDRCWAELHEGGPVVEQGGLF